MGYIRRGVFLFCRGGVLGQTAWAAHGIWPHASLSSNSGLEPRVLSGEFSAKYLKYWSELNQELPLKYVVNVC